VANISPSCRKSFHFCRPLSLAPSPKRATEQISRRGPIDVPDKYFTFNYMNWCPDNSDDIATGYGLQCPQIDSWEGQEIFIFSITSRPDLGHTQPSIQWVQGAHSPEVKRPGREADHIHLVPRSRVVELYLHSPTRLHGVLLN
jgi:hypothetical protein